MPRPESRPDQCTVAYQIELTLRSGYSWEAMIPTTEEQLFGWLRSMEYRKKLRQKMTEKEIEEFDEEVHGKARNIREEVSRGSWHEDEDSPLPNDLRFKRTRNGHLYIGAGNILAMIREVAFRDEDNAGWLRRLKTRMWISPGKVVFLRYQEQAVRGILRASFAPISCADGRHIGHLPPEPPGPANHFRGKPATIRWSERIDCPADLRFVLWTTSDVEEQSIMRWFAIAQEYGLGGARAAGQGKFNVARFQRLSDDARARLIAEEERKAVAITAR